MNFFDILLSDYLTNGGDLWNADEKTTSTSGYERYGMTLEGGHTYVVVNNSYGGYGGERDSRDCFWMDKGGTMESGNLTASAGRTQAAVLNPTGELHIWVGITPSPFFHIYRFDMGAATRDMKNIDDNNSEGTENEK